MYSDVRIPESCQELWQQCQDMLVDLVQHLPVKTKSLILPSQSTLDFNNKQSFYCLKEGILKEYFNDTLIVNYEEDDLVGLQCLVDNNQLRIETDFAVTVDEYDIKDFLNYIAADAEYLLKWHKYLATLNQSWHLLASEHCQGEIVFHPEIREYDQGQTIIHQGDTDNEVFTLISGSAGVIVQGTQVGKIHCDEVFGALAALTGTPRTADVVALSDCTVLVVSADRFQELLVNRPETVAKLIEDMARTIISSNEQILALSTKT